MPHPPGPCDTGAATPRTGPVPGRHRVGTGSASGLVAPHYGAAMPWIVVASVAFAVLVTVGTLVFARKNGAFGMSKKQAEQSSRLIQTGAKARAWIMAIQPTGMVVNNVNVQCDVHFRLEPLHGGGPFDVSKRVLLTQTAMPRLGDVWPAWFDPSDPSTFTVGQPNAYTPESLAVLREFGIATPFDRPPG